MRRATNNGILDSQAMTRAKTIYGGVLRPGRGGGSTVPDTSDVSYLELLLANGQGERRTNNRLRRLSEVE